MFFLFRVFRVISQENGLKLVEGVFLETNKFKEFYQTNQTKTVTHETKKKKNEK